MIKKYTKPLVIISLLFVLPFFVTACTKGTSAPAATSNKVSTDFPLPAKVENLMDLGDAQLNFQTTLSLKEALEFYRQEFNKLGLVEKTVLTVIDEKVLSVVFEGSKNGKDIVVQGVIVNGKTNINIRYEKL